MDALFGEISERVGDATNKIIAVHNAVVDVVYQIPLTVAEFKKHMDSGEQRFHGPKHERIGGGGINFALTASSLGSKGTIFVGFMDEQIHAFVEMIKRESTIPLPLLVSSAKARRNTIIELVNGNVLLHDASASTIDVADLMRRIKSLEPGHSDWIASCSFYESVTFPLLDLSKRFFLDSGYGYPRREKAMMSRLCQHLAGKSVSDFIVATNEREVENISGEFGKEDGSIVEKGFFAADQLSNRSGTRVSILLHTAAFSTVFEPDNRDFWVIPCLDIEVKRRTNAGDTFAGAFLPAYDATQAFKLAVAYANAATAKRLADDIFPTSENVAEFLKRAKLRDVHVAGARTVSVGELKELSSRRALSACAPASPLTKRPVL